MRWALVVACALSLAGCAQTPAYTPAQGVALLGTWRLVSIFVVRKNGEQLASRFGTAPKGYLVYDFTGHMAVQIMGSPPLPVFQDSEKPTPQELQRLFDGYVAYAGTYYYDDAHKRVVHHVQISVDPHDIGQDFRRNVDLDGDRLSLTVQRYPFNGEEVQLKLTWERVR
jgi:Lipocalin-like domain